LGIISWKSLVVSDQFFKNTKNNLNSFVISEKTNMTNSTSFFSKTKEHILELLEKEVVLG